MSDLFENLQIMKESDDLSPDEIEKQLKEIDTHEYLKINIDRTLQGTIYVSINGTLINGNGITFWDGSRAIKTQYQINSLKEIYKKASEEIDYYWKTKYTGYTKIGYGDEY